MRVAARLLAFTVALVVLVPATPALAATQQIPFTDGTDRSSWYWNKQVDEEVGAGPISQRARLRSPQNRDTLPVAVEGGKLERISAIYFDISSRGVTPGSTITRAVLTIAEVSDPNEQPAYNTRGKVIQACPIDEFWPGGEAEKWDTQPNYADSGCVKGKRNARSDTPRWTFNLTPVARPWGEDPSGSNNGVMLVGVVPQNAAATESWQINVKIPSRDNQATPGDESRQTRNRAVLSLTYTPGEPSILAPPAPPPPAPPPPAFGGGAPAPPSSDFGKQPGGGKPAAPEPPGESIQAEPVAQAQPRAPWYVWLLIPIGLVAWAAVRPLVLEPTRGIRSEGAVVAIRRLNAERRGRPLEEPVDPLIRTLHGLQGAWRGIGRAAGTVGKGTGRVVGGIGSLAGAIARAVRGR